MLTPTALMNPTITALDTNRRTAPSRSSPATSMTAPVSSDSVTNARGALGPLRPGTSAITIAIAPVPCTAMNVELVTRAPVAVPTM
jgi:hypothetical protein